MSQENCQVSWRLHLNVVLREYGPHLNITKSGTLIVEVYRSEHADVTSIYSFNHRSRLRKDLGFGKHGGPEVSPTAFAPSTVGTSFPESLIMYEGGKSLLKYAM